MRTTLRIAAAALGCALAANAQAAFVYVDTPGSTPQFDTPVPAGANDFFAQLIAEDVFDYSLFASLGVSAPGRIIVDYFGKEAGFTNRFLFPGGQVTTSGTGFDAWLQRPGGSFEVVSAGVLEFSFCVIAGGSGCVTNAENDLLEPGALQNIGIRIIDDTTAWLLWDDSGAGPDDNHDDMIIRLTWTVPEPATLGLLGLGLLGAGAVARRRRA